MKKTFLLIAVILLATIKSWCQPGYIESKIISGDSCTVFYPAAMDDLMQKIASSDTLQKKATECDLREKEAVKTMLSLQNTIDKKNIEIQSNAAVTALLNDKIKNYSDQKDEYKSENKKLKLKNGIISGGFVAALIAIIAVLL